MKILIASIPVPGHLNPLLGVARILTRHGHDVLIQTATGMKSAVEAAGFAFTPMLPQASIDVETYLAQHPERLNKTPGPEMLRHDFENYFLPALPWQAEGLRQALQTFPADLVLAESLFLGTLPMLLRPREERPPVAHLGISVLSVASGANMPPIPGMSREELEAQTAYRRRVFLEPVQDAVQRQLMALGCRPLPCPLLESMAILPDLYLHPTIKSFQYVADPSAYSPVHYVGRLPLPPATAALPDWWDDLDLAKRLVLVTQGTVANRDFGQLVAPALKGLAQEKDLIVVVTTGGQPADCIPVEIPGNARVASFLPYEQVLPNVDLLITNGGYGTVNMALAHGVPIACAGLTEDKEEVSAHVQWSGAGIDLRTNQPSPQMIRSAARRILDGTRHRMRAKRLAEEFARHDTEAEVLTLLEACVATSTPASAAASW